MGALAVSEVVESVVNSISENKYGLGRCAEISKEKDCVIVLVKPQADNESSIKFGQVMHYLSNPQTWFYRSSHDAEGAFEKTLVRFGLPYKAKTSQQVEFVYRPPKGNEVLDVFCKEVDPAEVQKARENHETLIQCYETIDRALRMRKEHSYAKKSSTEVYGQRSLLDFNREEKVETRRQRNDSYRKIIFDVAYDAREVPAIIFGEIKAFSTVTTGLLDQRAYQLLGYDAWLKGHKDNITPFFYILPTVPSHREIKMAGYIKNVTNRDIVPLCITTPQSLRSDLEKRQNNLRIVEELSKREPVEREVLETHRIEHGHVLEFQKLLAEIFWD